MHIKLKSLTEEQKLYCSKNRYKYLVLFPNNGFKGCYTRRHSVVIVNRWNKKNPYNKICSLYNVITIQLYSYAKQYNSFQKLIRRFYAYKERSW